MADLDGTGRLGAVGAVLAQDAPDPELDALVSEAAALAGTPIALVSIVGRHAQLFRAQHGLPDELAASSGTSRSNSFCQFVVQNEAAFEVTDAVSDARVPQELVQTFGVRAYLGVPIRVRGQVLGSLCVLDGAPRRFAPDLAAKLTALAARASDRLEQLAGDQAAVVREAHAEAPVDRVAALASMRAGVVLLSAAVDAIDPMISTLTDLSPESITPEALLQSAPLGEQGIELHREIGDLVAHLDLVSEQLLPADRDRLLNDLASMAMALAEMGAGTRSLRAAQAHTVSMEGAVRALRVARDTFASFADLRAALARMDLSVRQLSARGPGTELGGSAT